MRSYKVKPINTHTFYDFVCPYCHFTHYKNKAEIERWKFDICYCGAQIIFDLSNIVPQTIPKTIQKTVPQKQPIISSKPPQTKPIPIKPIEISKKYDDKQYISLLKKLGMKVGSAKVLICDLIKMGYDPKNEELFTQKLLENIK